MIKEIKNIPKHVAIIPDGNRRWARKKRFQPWLGHEMGVKAFEKILEMSQKLNIAYITFWGGSWDNLTKRPKAEIDFLFKVYAEQFKRIIKDKRVHQNKVNINALGRWQEILPKKTQDFIEKAIKETKNYHNYFLTFLLAYDGRDEMLDCVKKIAKITKSEEIKISKDLIKKNLWTKDLPMVDLIIRTGSGSDPHLSAGFMMWDTPYSQLCFTETLFPDFSPKEFEEIIKNYSERERRSGV
jgi:tritrans,polycis-undecaprenyl-diphosphate synthase [geranylgeranyl-diphosphate specific]